MNWLSIFTATLAACALYLASPHQTLLPGARAQARLLRWGALPLLTLAALAGNAAYGFWCGVFVALSGFMLALVALPYLDAYRRSRHVG
ncbi:hypothetical protein [Massilia sp. BJB1822]|uniref:hypothetical protein n=1 Tax=Massilia sp. BJB1822 TaxID=2744470 RepID=UPI00159443EC|nr:hypothetical protein [Massilia sp. BJB1822]NVD99736.1 hypothetical protein [Massilia sp. BJB1822]